MILRSKNKLGIRKTSILLCIFFLFLSTIVTSQSKGVDFNVYLSSPSLVSLDSEFDYFVSRSSPLFHVRFGKDVYASNQKLVTLHLGTIIGTETYMKPSAFEGFITNTPADSVYANKSKFFAYLSLGAEFRKSFKENSKGMFLSAEPQFAFLVSSREKLVVRDNNIEIRNEKKNLKDELNTVNGVLILGAGYELGLFKRLSVMLAFHIEFRPIKGYYKNESHKWATRGFSTGIRYTLSKDKM